MPAKNHNPENGHDDNAKDNMDGVETRHPEIEAEVHLCLIVMDPVFVGDIVTGGDRRRRWHRSWWRIVVETGTHDVMLVKLLGPFETLDYQKAVRQQDGYRQA